jgi:hypothetical protein
MPKKSSPSRLSVAEELDGHLTVFLETLVRAGRRHRIVSVTRLLAAALRSFLPFCFVDGMTELNLSTAVLPVHRWQQAAVTRDPQQR